MQANRLEHGERFSMQAFYFPLANESMRYLARLLVVSVIAGMTVSILLVPNQPAYAHTGGLTLEPSDDLNVVGEQHTVTATLVDDNGASLQPLAGRLVSFSVTGANPRAGVGVTDSAGKATFSYIGSNQGDDIISATGLVYHCHDILCAIKQLDTATDSATKHWSMFVIPESPIGIIALMGASLAALGGFMFWK
jgi:hypothetical protein